CLQWGRAGEKHLHRGHGGHRGHREEQRLKAVPLYNWRMSLEKKDERRTEQRLAASKTLDRMTALEIVQLMNREDRTVAEAVERELPAIARAVDAIVAAMRAGG